MSITNDINSNLPELHSFCDIDPEIVDFCNKTFSKLDEEKEKALEEKAIAEQQRDEALEEKEKAITKYKEYQKMLNALKDKYIYALEIALGSR